MVCSLNADSFKIAFSRCAWKGGISDHELSHYIEFTSHAVRNLKLKKLDLNLTALCNKNGFVYQRTVDLVSLLDYFMLIKWILSNISTTKSVKTSQNFFLPQKIWIKIQKSSVNIPNSAAVAE